MHKEKKRKNFRVKGLLAINEGHLEGKIRLNDCTT